MPFCTAEEIDRAVQAAAAALPAWSETPAVERARVMFRFRERLQASFEELAALVTREHGKTIAEARAEMQRGIEMVEFACGIPSLLMGQSLREPRPQRRLRDEPASGRRLRRHHAVQFPVDGAAVDVSGGDHVRQHVRAQAVGEGAAVGDASWASCSIEAGLPAGVFNIVHGDKTARRCAARRIRWCGPISFVGSTDVAQHIYETGTAQRQTRASGRRGEEPSRSSCPTPISTRP